MSEQQSEREASYLRRRTGVESGEVPERHSYSGATSAPERRVLMMCYFFPPINTSGTARNVGFAAQLPRYGWEPVVLTVRSPKDSWGVRAMDAPVPEGLAVHRTGEVNLNRLVDMADALLGRLTGKNRFRIRDWTCIPDPQLAWAPLRRAVQLAADSRCIYVSASPFSSAIWAVVAKRLADRPLVVDFRDAWTLNPYNTHGGFHHRVARRQEQWVIRHSDRVILNTEGARDLYRKAYPQWRYKFTWIPNGYDHPNVAAKPGRDPLRIVHMGTFYGSRNPDRLLRAVQELSHLPIEFVQVGPGLSREAAQLPWVHEIPSVSHERALEMMRSASLLYLKQGDTHGGANIAVGAKTYEYLATGLPVLAECPPGDNADIVRRYATRSFVITNGSVEQIKRAIVQAYDELPDYEPRLNAALSRRFDRRRLTGDLAELFEQVSRNT